MIDNFFTTEVGSTIWQMRHPKSDTDLFRVYVASTEDILKGTANTRSKFIQENNTDIALHELGKVIEQLLKGNLNFVTGVMSPIVVEAHNPLMLHELRDIVRDNISKNSYHSIHGFAVHNYKKYIGSGKDNSERRCNRILRVLQFGITLLNTGKFEFKPFSGGVDYEIEEWIEILDDAYSKSTLPDKPDEEPFRQCLFDVRIAEWGINYRKVKK